MAASLQSAVFLSNRIDPHRHLFASPARSLPVGTCSPSLFNFSSHGIVVMVGVGLDACCHCAHAGARMKDQFSSSDVFFKDLKSLKKVIEDMSIQVNVPALAIEEVAPLVVSDATMLAPEEIFHGKGNIKEEAELTKEERKRRRANQKRRFRRLKAYAHKAYAAFATRIALYLPTHSTTFLLEAIRSRILAAPAIAYRTRISTDRQLYHSNEHSAH
ncbi:hypothetical protein ZIOFF_044622 [Zingiber officinale]|uniref:Uncharacterized protein n=1 Tax=Zingiber officinale TaxID=94328 RepID=A0A8J5L087_ZINOF|nr:hypothetical protein ZIOFF_044622 [Zingiber officinale]